MADVRETVEKKGIWADVLNLLKTIEENSEKHLKKLHKGRNKLNKRVDETAERIDKEFDKLKDVFAKPCKLLKNKESDLNQVSSSDSRGNNDDTFTNNSVNLSAVEIKNEVCEVNTNDNPNGVSLNINKEVTVNKVSNDCKTNGNYSGGVITNSNGNSSNANQVMNYKVSGSVKISNDETLLNKNIGDILNNSGDNENRIRVEVDQRLLVSVNDLEKSIEIV